MLMVLTHLIFCFISLMLCSLTRGSPRVILSSWSLKPGNDRTICSYPTRESVAASQVSTFIFLVLSHSYVCDLNIFRCCNFYVDNAVATSRKIAGSIPDEVIGLFN
jgi:hypothetical protein